MLRLRLAAARSAANFGLDESWAARSGPLAEGVPPPDGEGRGGPGDGARLAVEAEAEVEEVASTDGDDVRRMGASGGSTAPPTMLSSSAWDKSRPMPSIESGEGRNGRTSLPDAGREGGLSAVAVLLDPWGVVGGSASDSSVSSSSVSRADMERDSRRERPPSAARMAGRVSANAFDPELSRERGWLIDGRREMVTFKLADGRRESGAGRSLEGRRDVAGDKEGSAGVGGPS